MENVKATLTLTGATAILAADYNLMTLWISKS
jgi:hypothetical protein